ncbi:HupE/UreJ family protein [Microbulbifer sp. OS29]|uniref:HupE/UreJ family protein n=1 Tax=Microbulbifer okhotskensis TaxID=2926617 RepID=A0A9X2J5W6_9GAMM|nr:HupE/UreJ family protein [Microbulbifer okhotskensis]MCO1335623.1 HupE/UreJ family protein [Microbulbifer okhotskensis]
MKRLLTSLLGLLLLTLVPALWAHELRPAYLQIVQIDQQIYEVLWRVPAQGKLRLAMDVRFDDSVNTVSHPYASISNRFYTERWKIQHSNNLQALTIHIDGLQSTMTDALLRITWTDGREHVARLTPDQPNLLLDSDAPSHQIGLTYFTLGVEHILLGIDHLLFVLVLILLNQSLRQLIGTITAFTLAHSITLAAAALGHLQLPSAPIEAVIALSILLAACEAVRQRRGATSLTIRHPWLAAFGFGLLHGLGFAGALAEIGLPQGAIPSALLAFNLGVEIGQLLFITVVGLIFGLLIPSLKSWWQRTSTRQTKGKSHDDAPARTMEIPASMVSAYLVGGLASYWLIERTLLMVLP